ncbi:MAG: dTMP kinase [Spirochaetaceae bacterium]|nr:MAG: dTMP kinase [Spirochaetaceae bacterium]
MIKTPNNRPVLEHFYVFEGLDGAGTTTQAQLLVQTIHRDGHVVDLDREPTDGPVGLHIRDILGHRGHADHHSLALLFAADRRSHMYDPDRGVVARHQNGVRIVCDRYLPSSLAYQGVTCGLEQVIRFNGELPVPQRLFFLDVPVSVCLDRLEGRNERELFERETFLVETLSAYEAALEHMVAQGSTVYRIDGTQTVEEVHREVCRYLD